MSPVPVWSDRLIDDQLGIIDVWVSGAGVRRIDFRSDPPAERADELLAAGPVPDLLGATVTALVEYLRGRRRAFDLPLDLGAVSPFQRRVYERLLAIPFGTVVTYGEVARDVGGDASSTARAVGQAVGANPIAIVVPCHRVVPADHRLGEFGGGPERKAALLRLEGVDVDGAGPTARVRPDVLRLPL